MKKLVVFTLVLAMFNCQDDLNETTTEIANDAVPTNVISKAAALGYDTTTIPIYKSNDSYIIEGDMAFTEEDLEIFSTQKQRRTKGLIGCNNRLNISVKNDLNGIHSTALEDAIANWNSNSNNLISFSIATKNTTMLVRFAKPKDNLKETTAAAASGPKNRKAGSLIMVNTNYSGGQPWAKILTHELGHTIGFAHTNSSSGSYINGTLRDDPNSIMNTGGSAGCCISTGDKTALSKLYGNCARNRR